MNRDDSADAARRAREALAGEHLSYEQLAASVDGTAGAETRSAVETHTALCASCADELRDLQSFRDEPPRVRTHWRWWAAGLAAAAAIAVVLFLTMRPRPVERVPPAQPQVVETAGTADRSTPITPPDPAGTLEPEPSPPLRPVLAMLRDGRLPAAALLAHLRPGAGQQRDAGEGSKTTVQLVTPVGVVVEETRPRFRWKQGERGGSPWRVEIFDEAFARVAASGDVAGTEWQPREPLPRGANYAWQLSRGGAEREIVPKPPLPPARFRVLSAAAVQELRDAQGLDRALVYAREGMLDDAQRELDTLAKAHPDVALYRDLAASVETLRGQPLPTTANAAQ